MDKAAQGTQKKTILKTKTPIFTKSKSKTKS